MPILAADLKQTPFRQQIANSRDIALQQSPNIDSTVNILKTQNRFRGSEGNPPLAEIGMLKVEQGSNLPAQLSF